MYIQADTEVYCILGNPVKHSLSPILHTYMFEYYGINAVYVAFEPTGIGNAINALKSLGVKGANITVPFKREAVRFVDELDEDAAFLESINTVKLEDGKIRGFNTDYLGFQDMFLEYIKFYNDEDKIVIVGAGGVAVSVLYAMYKLGIKRVFVLNRSYDRALNLKKKFEGKMEVFIGGLNDRETISSADIIINCTSIGLKGDEVPIELEWVFEPLIIDVIYFDTPLVKKARQAGLVAVNGMEMFINQAFYSFKIWTGIEFDKENAKTLLEDVMA